MDTQLLIEKLQREKEYRPTVLGVLYHIGNDRVPRFLIAQSAKNTNYWGLVQGGIDEGENLEKCFYRENEEELGVGSDAIMNVHIGYGTSKLDAAPDRLDRRGFTKGKAYFFCAGEIKPSTTFTLKKDELAAVQWVGRIEAESFFKNSRPKKSQLNLTALDDLIHTLARRKY